MASNNGINYYNTDAFDIAGKSFDIAASVARTVDMVDTMAVYNAALSLRKRQV